jgi:hypothetical protein
MLGRKVDLRKRYGFLYAPSEKEIQVVDVPAMKFLTVDGSGDTASERFQKAIGTLYNLSFTTKFAVRKEEKVDYPVMALEGLWWTPGSSEGFDPKVARQDWKWMLMMMQPDFVTEARIADSAERIRKKGRLLEPFKLTTFHEGLSAQIMHVGPYSAETPTIERIWGFIRQNGYVTNGKHHEIYIGDPRRASPSKLRTILRQPIRRK